MATPLESGNDFIIQQIVSGKSTPFYPVTKTSLVKDSLGNTVDDIISGLAKANHGNHVPDYSGETTSSLKFLRNDNTWATIQNASTSQKGVVQLSDATNSSSSSTAATSKAVKSIADTVSSLSTNMDSTYVKGTRVGAATANGVVGIATLDANGLVPSSQLPSYVDDVVEVTVAADLKSATDSNSSKVTPESGKIYVNAVGDNANNKCYRWSGTQFVEISSSLALGTTSSTAFRGDYGQTAYQHSQANHARTDATKTEASSTNGYIKINGTETVVYTHPAGTNPHGTTKSDVGLDKVENKSASEIINTLTASIITTKLGYTPQNSDTFATSSQNGVMSKTYAAKLDKCQEIEITSSTPTITNGIVFKVLS